MPTQTKNPQLHASPATDGTAGAQPLLKQHGHILQQFGTVLPNLP